MATDTHYCPGCGKPGIARSRLACPLCWYRLPQSLREEAWRGWKVRGVYPATHLAAVSAALDWYRRERSAETPQDDGRNPAGESGSHKVDAGNPRGNGEQEAHQAEQQQEQRQRLHNPHRSPEVR